LSAPAVKAMLTLRSPTVAASPVGAPGTARGVALTALEAAPLPPLLIARSLMA